jgi:hypothetical protein
MGEKDDIDTMQEDKIWRIEMEEKWKKWRIEIEEKNYMREENKGILEDWIPI